VIIASAEGALHYTTLLHSASTLCLRRTRHCDLFATAVQVAKLPDGEIRQLDPGCRDCPIRPGQLTSWRRLSRRGRRTGSCQGLRDRAGPGDVGSVRLPGLSTRATIVDTAGPISRTLWSASAKI